MSIFNKTLKIFLVQNPCGSVSYFGLDPYKKFSDPGSGIKDLQHWCCFLYTV